MRPALPESESDNESVTGSATASAVTTAHSRAASPATRVQPPLLAGTTVVLVTQSPR